MEEDSNLDCQTCKQSFSSCSTTRCIEPHAPCKGYVFCDKCVRKHNLLAHKTEIPGKKKQDTRPSLDRPADMTDSELRICTWDPKNEPVCTFMVNFSRTHIYSGNGPKANQPKLRHGGPKADEEADLLPAKITEMNLKCSCSDTPPHWALPGLQESGIYSKYFPESLLQESENSGHSKISEAKRQKTKFSAKRICELLKQKKALSSQSTEGFLCTPKQVQNYLLNTLKYSVSDRQSQRILYRYNLNLYK